jgi:DNA-binding phage protein
MRAPLPSATIAALRAQTIARGPAPVAAAAGVSTRTLSRALRGEPLCDVTRHNLARVAVTRRTATRAAA